MSFQNDTIVQATLPAAQWVSFTYISSLPPEVLQNVIANLQKGDIKKARLVCKYWSSVVTPLLFDTAIISPTKIDLELFTSITEHPTISRSIRTLVYDVQEFITECSKFRYVQQLLEQISNNRYFRDCTGFGSRHPDSQIQRILEIAMVYKSMPLDTQYSEFLRLFPLPVIESGYAAYIEKANEQVHYNNSGEVLARLLLGLPRLQTLQNIHVRTVWPLNGQNVLHRNSSDYHESSSSSFASTWNNYYLRPRCPESGQHIAFANIMLALSLTRTCITNLNMSDGYGVAADVFHRSLQSSRIAHEHTLVAVKSLRGLNLRVHDRNPDCADEVAREEEAEMIKCGAYAELLTNMLSCMPHLQFLGLHMGRPELGDPLQTLPDICVQLPCHHVWPHMRVLLLEGMSGSEHKILSFLRAQKALRILALSHIELKAGSWAGLTAGFRSSLSLDAFRLTLPLWSPGAIKLWDMESWEKLHMSEDIESYVLKGGENPLLTRSPGPSSP